MFPYPVQQCSGVAHSSHLLSHSPAAACDKASKEASPTYSTVTAAGDSSLASVASVKNPIKYEDDAVADGQDAGRKASNLSSASTASLASTLSSPGSLASSTTNSPITSKAPSLASTPTTEAPTSSSRCAPTQTDKDVRDICGLFAETSDVRLLVCLLSLCGMIVMPEQQDEAEPSMTMHQRHLEEEMPESVVRLVLRALEMLRRCKYSVEDICVVCAHATVYFKDAYRRQGERMDWAELGNVLVLSLFLGHTYALDTVCPLHIWHKFNFGLNKGCSLKDLDAAVVRILGLRNWLLRVEEPRLHALNEEFCKAAAGAR